MDKKKIAECLEEMAEKIIYLKEMIGEEKKEISSMDELQEKAEEKLSSSED